MYSNSLVRMETDGIYISINVETATEGICRGDCDSRDQWYGEACDCEGCANHQHCYRACATNTEPAIA